MKWIGEKLTIAPHLRNACQSQNLGLTDRMAGFSDLYRITTLMVKEKFHYNTTLTKSKLNYILQVVYYWYVIM